MFDRRLHGRAAWIPVLVTLAALAACGRSETPPARPAVQAAASSPHPGSPEVAAGVGAPTPGSYRTTSRPGGLPLPAGALTTSSGQASTASSGGGGGSTRLARVTPGSEPALEAAITEALETGQPARWNDEEGLYSGSATVGAGRGEGCRTYSYTVRHGAEAWSSPPRTACRDDNGDWRRR